MKTWRTMTEDERRTFLEAVRQDIARAEAEALRALRLRRRRARRLARRLARVLRERYGAKRVVLVGSLAQGNFTAWSDVDLVVFGVPPELFFRAYGEALRWGERAGIPVEVFCGDTASFPAQALEGGIEL